MYTANPDMFGKEPTPPKGRRGLRERRREEDSGALAAVREETHCSLHDMAFRSMPSTTAMEAWTSSRRRLRQWEHPPWSLRFAMMCGTPSPSTTIPLTGVTPTRSTAWLSQPPSLSSSREEVRRVLKPGGLNIYTVRNTADPHYRTGIDRGDDMWEIGGGFVVHFFSRKTVEHLAQRCTRS